MQIETIKIVAPTSTDNPLGYVVINRADFDPSKQELLEGESLGDTGNTSGDTGDGVPTLAELIASRNQLLERSDELDDRELRLNQRAGTLDEREQELAARESALAEREAANHIEAQRLADEKAALAATGTAGAPNYSAMSKDELQAALTAKGTSFPASANKAELLTLLTAA